MNFKECNQGIAKGLFMVVNGLCILLAYCILGFAVVDIRLLNQYGQEHASGTFVGDVIVICASVLLIIIAGTGLIGAIKENLKIIYMYVALLMILIVLQMLITIFVAVQRHGLQFRVTEWLREDFFSNVTEERRGAHERMWDDLQIRYECCGLNGPDDYPAIQQPISLSCCPRAYRARTSYAQQELYKSCLHSASYFSEGCEDEILYFLQADAECLLGAAIFCFWMQGAGMLLAMWMTSNIKNTVTAYKQTVKY
ncbi:unnamed protein product [Chilo suppressalis]|uniref:Tetraspanin n=1 Tax=Chilo suppressalis TaxID=168631 RepID=A0ABN8BA39_CHISP|nr:unnamed protein product [Chilo suppressalis]